MVVAWRPALQNGYARASGQASRKLRSVKKNASFF